MSYIKSIAVSLYRCIAVSLILFSLSTHASSVLVKQNNYGKLTDYADEAKLVFSGSQGKITIVKAESSLKYTFYDGSYIYIDLSKNILSRYSALTHRTENFTSTRLPTSVWNVNNRVRASLTQLQNFNDYPDMKDADPNPCDRFSSSEPCDFRPLGNDLEFNLMNDMESRFSTSSAACSSERDNFLNKGFKGHSSLNKCLMRSRIKLAINGGLAIVICVSDPSKLICAGTVGLLAIELSEHGDQAQACMNSYHAAHKALETCEANNGGGSSGGSGGSEGNTGGSNGGSTGGGGGGGFKRVCYSVVTGGGVTSWCDFKPV